MITQEITVVNREPLHEKRGEARPSSSSKGVEDEETLEPGALVRELPHPVKNQVDDLLPDGVVAASVVVGGVLLAGDQLLGVEELPVGAEPHLVHHGRLKVDKDSSRHVLARPGLREEGVEGVIAATSRLVGRHRAIRLDPCETFSHQAHQANCLIQIQMLFTMLKTVELPASVADLTAGLANVDADALSLVEDENFS